MSLSPSFFRLSVWTKFEAPIRSTPQIQKLSDSNYEGLVGARMRNEKESKEKKETREYRWGPPQKYYQKEISKVGDERYPSRK
jgi:hypothetical protein